jgi:hypothetical protein
MYVEAKSRKEAHKMVMEEKCRLLDFPKSWSFHPVPLQKEKRNGKWYDEK